MSTETKDIQSAGEDIVRSALSSAYIDAAQGNYGQDYQVTEQLDITSILDVTQWSNVIMNQKQLTASGEKISSNLITPVASIDITKETAKDLIKLMDARLFEKSVDEEIRKYTHKYLEQRSLDVGFGLQTDNFDSLYSEYKKRLASDYAGQENISIIQQQIQRLHIMTRAHERVFLGTCKNSILANADALSGVNWIGFAPLIGVAHDSEDTYNGAQDWIGIQDHVYNFFRAGLCQNYLDLINGGADSGSYSPPVNGADIFEDDSLVNKMVYNDWTVVTGDPNADTMLSGFLRNNYPLYPKILKLTGTNTDTVQNQYLSTLLARIIRDIKYCIDYGISPSFAFKVMNLSFRGIKGYGDMTDLGQGMPSGLVELSELGYAKNSASDVIYQPLTRNHYSDIPMSGLGLAANSADYNLSSAENKRVASSRVYSMLPNALRGLKRSSYISTIISNELIDSRGSIDAHNQIKSQVANPGNQGHTMDAGKLQDPGEWMNGDTLGSILCGPFTGPGARDLGPDIMKGTWSASSKRRRLLSILQYSNDDDPAINWTKSSMTTHSTALADMGIDVEEGSDSDALLASTSLVNRAGPRAYWLFENERSPGGNFSFASQALWDPLRRDPTAAGPLLQSIIASENNGSVLEHTKDVLKALKGWSSSISTNSESESLCPRRIHGIILECARDIISDVCSESHETAVGTMDAHKPNFFQTIALLKSARYNSGDDKSTYNQRKKLRKFIIEMILLRDAQRKTYSEDLDNEAHSAAAGSLSMDNQGFGFNKLPEMISYHLSTAKELFEEIQVLGHPADRDEHKSRIYYIMRGFSSTSSLPVGASSNEKNLNEGLKFFTGEHVPDLGAGVQYTMNGGPTRDSFVDESANMHLFLARILGGNTHLINTAFEGTDPSEVLNQLDVYDKILLAVSRIDAQAQSVQGIDFSNPKLTDASAGLFAGQEQDSRNDDGKFVFTATSPNGTTQQVFVPQYGLHSDSGLTKNSRFDRSLLIALVTDAIVEILGGLFEANFALNRPNEQHAWNHNNSIKYVGYQTGVGVPGTGESYGSVESLIFKECYFVIKTRLTSYGALPRTLSEAAGPQNGITVSEMKEFLNNMCKMHKVSEMQKVQTPEYRTNVFDFKRYLTEDIYTLQGPMGYFTNLSETADQGATSNFSFESLVPDLGARISLFPGSLFGTSITNGDIFFAQTGDLLFSLFKEHNICFEYIHLLERFMVSWRKEVFRCQKELGHVDDDQTINFHHNVVTEYLRALNYSLPGEKFQDLIKNSSQRQISLAQERFDLYKQAHEVNGDADPSQQGPQVNPAYTENFYTQDDEPSGMFLAAKLWLNTFIDRADNNGTPTKFMFLGVPPGSMLEMKAKAASAPYGAAFVEKNDWAPKSSSLVSIGYLRVNGLDSDLRYMTHKTDVTESDIQLRWSATRKAISDAAFAANSFDDLCESVLVYDTTNSKAGDVSDIDHNVAGHNVGYTVTFQDRTEVSLGLLRDLYVAHEEQAERFVNASKKTIVSEILKFIFEKASSLAMHEKNLVKGNQAFFNNRIISEASKSLAFSKLFNMTPSIQMENFSELYEFSIENEESLARPNNNDNVIYTNLKFGTAFNKLLTPEISQDQFANPIILPPKVNDYLLMASEILSPSCFFKSEFDSNQASFTDSSQEDIRMDSAARSILVPGLFDYVVALEVPNFNDTDVDIHESPDFFDNTGEMLQNVKDFLNGPANIDIVKPIITLTFETW